MEPWTRNDLRRLADQQAGTAVTLTMPTHRADPEKRQNTIRFRNLLDEAEEKLGPEEASILDSARDTLGDEDFWRHPLEGLVMFINRRGCERYHLPYAVDERVTIADRFDITPLLQLVEDEAAFYILAVSQNRVRLLRATRYSVVDLDPAELPQDLEQALNIDEYTDTLQHHETGGRFLQRSQFHGQGGSGQEVYKRDELLQYFHRIAEAISSFFNQQRAILVFAGVDYLFPIFQEACRYRGLVDEPVTGNPDELSPEELQRAALAIAEPHITREKSRALQLFHDAGPGERVLDQVANIVTAARRGQVETLLLREGAQVKGSIRDAGERVIVGQGEDDLIRDAAAHTIINSGFVYTLDPSDLSPPAAALLRQPFYSS